ncbi:MAG: mechanosensitive ion channel, partial [Kiritimatiellaceae bacterium]|nr:mechanosensitive ion channel [Kiritimatiellaceae bacterium]
TVLEGILAADSRVLKDPGPTVAVVEMADSSVNLVVRPWCTGENYWGVYFDTTEAIKKAFDEAGISIPFPQRDVHLYEHKAD